MAAIEHHFHALPQQASGGEYPNRCVVVCDCGWTETQPVDSEATSNEWAAGTYSDHMQRVKLDRAAFGDD